MSKEREVPSESCCVGEVRAGVGFHRHLSPRTYKGGGGQGSRGEGLTNHPYRCQGPYRPSLLLLHPLKRHAVVPGRGGEGRGSGKGVNTQAGACLLRAKLGGWVSQL